MVAFGAEDCVELLFCLFCDSVLAGVGFQFVHCHSMDVGTLLILVLIHLSPRDFYSCSIQIQLVQRHIW